MGSLIIMHATAAASTSSTTGGPKEDKFYESWRVPMNDDDSESLSSALTLGEGAQSDGGGAPTFASYVRQARGSLPITRREYVRDFFV